MEDDALPLKFNSSHSGHSCPEDFVYACPRDMILWGRDALVKKLFDHNLWHGGCFPAFQFPTTYRDPNSALVALDAVMIDGGWQGPVKLTKKTYRAIGLIWKRVDDEHEFYDRILSQADVQNCIVGSLTTYARCHILCYDMTISQHTLKGI